MNITDYETSKKLFDLGVNLNEDYIQWYYNHKGELIPHEERCTMRALGDTLYPAYDLGVLVRALPSFILIRPHAIKYILTMVKVKDRYLFEYRFLKKVPLFPISDLIPEAAAGALLIKLIEEKYITVEKINGVRWK